jgi:predicted ATP-grasp superfamily ATP-dependent carboligase
MRRPTVVAAFQGWNDAADAASDAITWLARRTDAEEFAAVAAEDYFDFQAARPTVELVDGVVRSLTWPTVRFHASERANLVLVLGIEPNLRWRTFCADVIEVVRRLDAALVITLGALLGDTPHSRPMRITGSTTDPTVAERLGVERSRYEGPTGIVGVLHDAVRNAGIPSASFWAPVPHYVATPPNPKATRALLDRVRDLLALDLDLTDLDIAASAWERSVSEVVAGDSEVSAYVARLERRFDDSAGEGSFLIGSTGEEDEGEDLFDEDDLPSGDALAADFEQYLRDQDDS